ncbi:MAG: Rap1a/Tai family immunity protein [Deltaproteobacteria bacterium]|nr:Rap1a/Tai family immunity protein [Deltaproteobacteria bacterium]
MKIRKLTVVMIALVIVSGVAFADKSVGDARWLHEKWIGMHSSEACNPRDLTMFDGFVIAVAQVAENTMSHAIVIPWGTTFGQVFDVVGRYLENHPEDWNTDADTVVIKALQAAFPVKR